MNAVKEKLTNAEEKITKLENMNQQLMEKIRKRDKEEEKRKKKEEERVKKNKEAEKENASENKEEEKKPEKTPRKRSHDNDSAMVTPVARRIQALREGAPRSSSKKIKTSDMDSPPPSYQSLFSPLKMETPEISKKSNKNPLLTLSSSLKKKKQALSS